MVFATSAVHNSLMSYTGYFGIIAAVMLAALVVFMLTVREPEWAAEMREQSVALGLEESGENGEGGGRRLSMDEIKSLVFILLSIVLWFFGYNAVTSKYSVYASNILHKDYNLTLIIAQAAAIVAYLPVGFIASKVGRKKTILAGVLMLTAAFTVASFLNASSPTMLMERDVRPRGHRVGDDQRQLLPDGGGDVLGRRRRQVHGLLLHGVHGRAGRDAHALGSADG